MLLQKPMNDSILSTLCQLTRLLFPVFQWEDESVKFFLSTRENPDTPCDLQPTEDALKKCNFDPTRETKVLVHGFGSKLPPNDLLVVIKDEFLKVYDCNVVLFNWTQYTQHDGDDLGYVLSASYTPMIGLKIAAWVNFLQEHTGVTPDNFHFVAHSLGSEVVSFAAKASCHFGRITYLDPAAPLFRFLPSYLKPRYTDANFVEAIHTNAALIVFKGYGLLFPLADIDYYPNGGSAQPQCEDGDKFEYTYRTIATVNSSQTKISCNHHSVIHYYIASFNKKCEYSGLICDSYEDFMKGTCKKGNSVECTMGFNSKPIPGLKPKSKCYLTTSKKSPYCTGKDGKKRTSS